MAKRLPSLMPSDPAMTTMLPALEEADKSFYSQLVSQWRSLTRSDKAPRRVFTLAAKTTQDRLDASLNDEPIDTGTFVQLQAAAAQEKQKTVLYLAYGSNLSNETFRGKRGVRPFSQVNVQVPSLRLTFNLPGIPYLEPCFANTALRDARHAPGHEPAIEGKDYRKNRWHKGLVGVVYEVTLGDYAHIMATEGGGSAYKDVLVDCHVLPDHGPVPTRPTSRPFKAHTLLAPPRNRPDPDYAQPSARYLKLITDGAAECSLPTEYQDYLLDLRPFTVTNRRQAVGKALFSVTWLPVVGLVFGLSRALSDKEGRVPAWFGKVSSAMFLTMWWSYDVVFKACFGDGERTIGDRKSGDEREMGEKQRLVDDAYAAPHRRNLAM